MTPFEQRINEAQTDKDIKSLVEEIVKDWLKASEMLCSIEDELLHLQHLHEAVIYKAQMMGRTTVHIPPPCMD